MAIDQRPDVAVGHVHLTVNDIDAEHAFFEAHGMRNILKRDDFSILELRGGTHLILRLAEDTVATGTRGPFDLMVDDIDHAYEKFVNAGVETSPIERGSIHDSFTVTSPSGYAFPVNSSHVAGPV